MSAKNSKKLSFSIFKDEMPKVSQAFISLEGEGINVGEPSLYIRFAGCYSAACEFCDTKFSWFVRDRFPDFLNIDKNNNVHIGEWYEKYDILNHIPDAYCINRVTITGGEPLHFINSLKYLPKIKHEFKVYKSINLNLIGVESNGNILAKIENTMNLIEVFKHLQNNGIEPSITISPKLDPKSCYQNQLTQKTIDGKYFYVYENMKKYFSFKYYYKFIWGASPEMNKIVKRHLYRLKYKLNIPGNQIFLMPFTPIDPTGKNKDIWERNKDDAAEKALKLGVRYSPRIHIDRGLD